MKQISIDRLPSQLHQPPAQRRKTQIQLHNHLNLSTLTVARLKHPVQLTHPYLANCPLVSVFGSELVPALACEVRPTGMHDTQIRNLSFRILVVGEDIAEGFQGLRLKVR